MKYNAIGMQAWQNLPNIFSDSEEAANLKGSENFWAYTYMFPSTAQPGVTCVMEAGISYSPLTNLFTKYVRNVGDE